MASLGDLFVVIGAKTEGFQKGISEATSGLGDFAKKAGIGLAAVGTAAVGMGVASVKSFADAGDEIQKMGQKTGFSTESLSELKYAAELSGASLGTIEAAARGMARALDSTTPPTTEMGMLFSNLGLTFEDLRDMSPENQFQTMANALARVEDPTQRAAAAMALFGKSGTDLLPMLAGGKEGLAGMRQEARDLGLVFSQNAADDAAAFNDALTKMQGAFSGVMFAIAKGLIPALQPLIDAFTKLIQKLPLKEIGELIGRLLPPLVDLLMQLLEAVPIDIIVEFVQAALVPLLNVVKALMPAIKPLLEILGTVLKILTPIIDAVGQLLTWIATGLGIGLQAIFGGIADGLEWLVEGFGKVFRWIKDNWPLLLSILTGPIGIAVGQIIKHWDAIKNAFISAWEAIKSAFASAVNFLIGLAEGWVNIWIRGINFIVGALNKIQIKIPDWIPGIGGKSFGINIPMVPEISLPRLATGGIVNGPMTALLGERGPEAVIPLSLLDSIGDRTITIINKLFLDGEQITAAVDQRMDRRIRLQAPIP